MKDFKTFLSEQKGMQAAQNAQTTEAEGGIAGLGHINPKEVLVTSIATPTMMRGYEKSIAYDWSNFLSRLPSLEGDLMMSDEDRKRLSRVVDSMPEGNRKSSLLSQVEKTISMPKSATRTQNVQSIMKQINDISMEAEGVNQSNFTPKTYIPNINIKNPWSNR